jgi:hypothetical protein
MRIWCIRIVNVLVLRTRRKVHNVDTMLIRYRTASRYRRCNEDERFTMSTRGWFDIVHHRDVHDVFVCLFYFESHEQCFSYLATVTITGDSAANLDLCLALTAFSSDGSFRCHSYCDTGPPLLRSYPKDLWFSLLNAVLLAKKQSLPILNIWRGRPERGSNSRPTVC